MAHETPSSSSPEGVVRALIEGACRAAVGDPSALENVVALYADPTFVLHPMRPDIPAVRTREDFLHHLAALREPTGTLPESREAIDIVVHETTDPEVIITEFRYRTVIDGTALFTPCIWVTRVRDGHIVEARDYNGQPSPVSQ